MENGRIIEQGDVLTVFRTPSHSVTKRFVKQVVNEDESLNTLDTLSKQFPDGKIVLLKYFKEMLKNHLSQTLFDNMMLILILFTGKLFKHKMVVMDHFTFN